MKNIIVVALDINKQDNLFSSFQELAPNVQLKMLLMAIEQVAKELSVTQPNAKWIVAWREYGITGMMGPRSSGETCRSISKEIKDNLKNELTQLTAKYPQLTIVAGSVLKRRPKKVEALDKIKDFYKSQKPIRDKETHLAAMQRLPKDIDSVQQLARHEQQVDEVIAQTKPNCIQEAELKVTDIEKAELKVADSKQEVEGPFAVDVPETGQVNSPIPPRQVEVNVLSNIVYVFQKGQVIGQHAKIAPFEETSKEPKHANDSVFQPGSKKNNALVDIGDGIVLIIDICREHSLKAAEEDIKKYMASAKKEDKMTCLYFILSDSVVLEPANIYKNPAPKHIFHLDSKFPPRNIENQFALPTKEQVIFFQKDVLDSKSKLIGPLEPVAIFEQSIVKEFDNLLSKLQDNSPKKAYIEKLKADFLKEANSMLSGPAYDVLEKALTDRKIIEFLEKEEGAVATLSSFFSIGPNIKKWAANILAMVAAEREKHPVVHNYASTKPSAIIGKTGTKKA